MLPTWNRLLLCNHISQTCPRATALFNSLSQPSTSTQLNLSKLKVLSTGWQNASKPAPAQQRSPLQEQYCYSKDWYNLGWRRQPQTNHSSRKNQGREVLKIRWSDYVHVTGSQQHTARCSRSYWSAVTTELTPLQGCIWLLNSEVPNLPPCRAWRLPALQPFLCLDGKPTHF